MKTNNTRRTERGFTMVEILVTLSMAGVLSSVALPTTAAFSPSSKTDPAASPVSTAAGATSEDTP
jgi:prepilin-type N-terminal cleavage/methylation domain-containing protein